MALIARDLMVGNPKLKKAGFGEEANGHFAIASGFQGQRQWTDHMPNGDFLEAILSTSFDWNGRRAPYIVATENDALNGVSMLFGYLLTNTAQIFADLRTYLEPDAVKRVTGHQLDGAPRRAGLLHLINSGPAALDGSGQQSGEWRASDETLLGNHRGGSEGLPRGHDVASLDDGIFPGRRLEHALRDPRRHAGDDLPAQHGGGPWARSANRRGRNGRASRQGAPAPRGSHESHLADDAGSRPTRTAAAPSATRIR